MNQITPLGEFAKWLPGELAYSASAGKAPYPSKIERARRPIDDPSSIYGFLGSEWHHHQLLRRQGKHHTDEHEKTAQLQLAKFAAGLFDKVALAHWMEYGFEEGDEAVKAAIDMTMQDANDYGLGEPVWPDFDPARELEIPFADTKFAIGIQNIMRDIVKIVDTQGAPNNAARLADLPEHALRYGLLAVQCYQAYAELDLTPDQYALAASEL